MKSSFSIPKTNLLFLLVAFSWTIFLATGCEKQCEKNEECPTLSFCDPTTKSCLSQCKNDKECKENELCIVSIGLCKTKENSCKTQASKGCVGTKIFWFDSCGTQEQEIEDCGQKGCLDGVCKKGNICGDGTCVPGQEDCLSCPQDCKCESGEICDTKGICVRTCGNGTCDSTTEDCANCPQDCRCQQGQICEQGTCKEQKKCGDGVCDSTLKEDCITCPFDCTCKNGTSCKNGTCEQLCGNGVCDKNLGETCAICPEDCSCVQGQICQDGLCQSACGNGKCEPGYNEDCSSCPKDCSCPTGQQCSGNGQCGASCGNGICDTAKGETCATCSTDCACESTRFCQNGTCQLWCGNGVCDQARGENCSTCALDCGCPNGYFCSGDQCKAYCGDGVCDSNRNEDCSTCLEDCACTGGKSCVAGICKCVPDCQGKNCGDDGCGGSCGDCNNSRQLCEKNVCTCQDECSKTLDVKCVDASNFKVCIKDPDGCFYWVNAPCPTGKACNNDKCCELQCSGKECGDDGCGGSCGFCSQRSICSSGKCTCQHECSTVGLTSCSGSGSYKECYQDTSGCRYWSAVKTCGSGRVCHSTKCCTPSCSGRECGSDGCNGSCGTCSNCQNNRCLRTIVFQKIYAPCSSCTDPFSGKPEFYIELTLSNGTKYKSKVIETSCGKTLTYNWTVANVDPLYLKNVTIKIMDEDVDADDTCTKWSNVDLTAVNGSKTLTGSNSASVTFTVSK